MPFFGRYWMGSQPWENYQAYWSRSPLSLVGNMKTPTLVVVGAEDYRTPVSESEQLYSALKLKGVPTALVKVPDASHGGIAARPSQSAAKAAAGELTLFDRSWYNRAGVEPVMGFCTLEERDAFLRAVPEFERHLVNDGILLFKYWLCCDQERQEARFENRLKNPLKRWKLSPIDIHARERYDAYTEARERMLKETHTDFAPWTLVDYNDQALGRLTLLRDLLNRVPDTSLPVKELDWPPLSDEPLKERYGVLHPIPPYDLQTAPRDSTGEGLI